MIKFYTFSIFFIILFIFYSFSSALSSLFILLFLFFCAGRYGDSYASIIYLSCIVYFLSISIIINIYSNHIILELSSFSIDKCLFFSYFYKISYLFYFIAWMYFFRQFHSKSSATRKYFHSKMLRLKSVKIWTSFLSLLSIYPTAIVSIMIIPKGYLFPLGIDQNLKLVCRLTSVTRARANVLCLSVILSYNFRIKYKFPLFFLAFYSFYLISFSFSILLLEQMPYLIPINKFAKLKSFEKVR